MGALRAERIPSVRIKNKAEVAEFFGISLPTLDTWIRKDCPCIQPGGRGVQWQFDVLEVAKWKYGGQDDSGDYGEVLDPAQERARLDLERRRQLELLNREKAGTLIPFDLMEQLLGSAFSDIRAGLLSQHNIIASEYPEIPADAIRGILRRNKDLLTALAQTRIPESIRGALESLRDGNDSTSGDDSK